MQPIANNFQYRRLSNLSQVWMFVAYTKLVPSFFGICGVHIDRQSVMAT